MKLKGTELKSAIVGMVIGDGCLSRRYVKGNAYFQISHSEKQFEYMLWKQKILDNITSSSIDPTERILNDKTYKGYHLGTRRHPFFTKLHTRFYHNGKKSLDEHLVKLISPLALAIIFMDDGTIGKQEGKTDSLFLCMQSFDYANQFLLKKSLKIKYDLDWNINKANKAKDGTRLYRLRLASRHNERFYKVVDKYIKQVSCMLYKLDSNSSTS